MTYKWSVKSTKMQEVCIDILVGTGESGRNFKGCQTHVKGKVAGVGLSIPDGRAKVIVINGCWEL